MVVRIVVGVALLAAGVTGAGPTHAADSNNDALAPKTRVEDARTGPLHTVTLATNDVESVAHFFVDAMGMRIRGPLQLPRKTRVLQRRLWGIPARIGWDLYVLDRPGAEDAIQIRVIALDHTTPSIHNSWQPIEVGPYSLGFPTEDLEAWEPQIRSLGFGAMNPMQSYPVPRPDGSTYQIHETIFTAPEFLHAVGISRRDGMAQLGPTDPATGNGGPVYSAQIVRDSDAQLAFYTDVLGMELRSDREWKSSGRKGAMGNPDGSIFRFSIVYSMGARWGHLLFVHFRNVEVVETGVAPRLPNRGLAMWSFPVRDLEDTVARLNGAGVEIVGGPVSYESPELGVHSSLTVLDPNGMMIELFQPTD